MLLAKAVEQAYRRQLQTVNERCPECGVYLKRVEYEEYGRCWLCHQEAGENADQRGN